MTKKTIWFRN